MAEPWQLLGEGREVPCPQQEGLLLLVPLVLGLGKVRPPCRCLLDLFWVRMSL